MIDKKLIAPCGMNCAICVAFFGYTMADKKRKMSCPGCKPSNKSCAHIKKYCKKLLENKIEYCYECSDFPCKYLKRLDDKYIKRFDMSMIENLKQIKKEGMDKFLKMQKEKYTCPNCGNLICVHTNKCYNCNYSI